MMRKLFDWGCGITVTYYVIALILFLNLPLDEMNLAMEIIAGAVCFIIAPLTLIGPILSVIEKYRDQEG